MSDNALLDCLQIIQHKDKMKKLKNISGFLDKPFILCYSIYRVKGQQVLKLIKSEVLVKTFRVRNQLYYIFEIENCFLKNVKTALS